VCRNASACSFECTSVFMCLVSFGSFGSFGSFCVLLAVTALLFCLVWGWVGVGGWVMFSTVDSGWCVYTVLCTCSFLLLEFLQSATVGEFEMVAVQVQGASFTIITKVFVSAFICVGLSSILLDFFITILVFSMVLSVSFRGGSSLPSFSAENSTCDS